MDAVGLVAVGAFALGTGSLAVWALISLRALFTRVRQFAHPRWQASLEAFFARQEAVATDRDEDEKASRSWAVFMPVVAGLALALLARDWLLSPYLMLLGLAMTYFLRSRQSRKEQSAVTEQVKALVLLFRSRFAVGESPFSVLAAIEGELPSGRVRTATRRVVDIYHARGDATEALAAMRRVSNPYLARLVMVLEASGSSSTEVVVDELKRLEDDLKAHDRLRGQAKASLALLKGTVRFLQTANLTAVVVSVVLPLYHDFFSSTLQRRGTFLAATLFLALASLYFDQEIALQEEKVL